jgi:hypothetical protein
MSGSYNRQSGISVKYYTSARVLLPNLCLSVVMTMADICDKNLAVIFLQPSADCELGFMSVALVALSVFKSTFSHTAW